ncbi:hypothetical protein O6H91_20G020800 [Diphasiastrum complanatum]|uniref:Uncharacterized protein n=1 Tax=Diphasiastrum complanatum TaxID=34168 RepID=A0ACC2AN93_DIPCM|nr:hypothetical protein O6H91_20G020800 [Diphasiastrum complanatum]
MEHKAWPLLLAAPPYLQGAAGSLIAATVTILLGCVLWYFVARRSWASKYGLHRMPPGNFSLPFLGETREYILLQKANKGPEFFRSRAAKYGEVFSTSLFGFLTVSLPAPSGNKFLFSTENTQVINQWPECLKPLLGEESVAWQTGEEHKHTRSVLMTFLDPEALQRFVGRVSAVVQKHLDNNWEGKKQIVVFPLMKRLTFSIACSLFLSVENEDEISNLLTHFCSYAAGMLQVPIDFPGTKYRKAKFSRRLICEQLDELTEKRRKELDLGTTSENQDLLATLLTTRDGKGRIFSNSAIQDNVIALLFAGHDTTSSTISLTLKFLAENKTCLHQVLQEQLQIKSEKSNNDNLNWEDLKKMKYTWKVVQETLRLQPPVQGGFRKALVDIEISGYKVPKGTPFYWTVHRSHKDAKLFPNPEKFDPSRFEGTGPPPYTFVPFGGGPRICPASCIFSNI